MGASTTLAVGPAQQPRSSEAIELIERHLGVAIEPVYADTRPGDQPIYVSDIRLAREELGWEPTTDVETGIAELAAWVNENRPLFEAASPAPQR